MIARHHISPFSRSHSNLSLPLHLSPFQPMPYLLNPTSVTALNAKALPRQMIKVSSQFTLQCIDLMFPNLPGLSLMLPRTLRIFHSVPPFPAFLSLPLYLSACVCLQTKYGWQRCFSGQICIWFLPSSKTYSLKITDSTESPEVIHMRKTTSKPPSFYNVITALHSPAVSNIVLE